MPAKYRYPLKRSPRSDPQQYRVYRMENEAIGARSYMKMSKKAMRKLARSVCRNYRVPQVRLSWTPALGKWAAEWVQPRVIRLNTKKGTAADLLTLTHELAHHIHHALSNGADAKQEDHGPQFMACHLSILDVCRVIPVIAMRVLCAAYKIRYMDPGTTNSLAKLRAVVRR